MRSLDLKVKMCYISYFSVDNYGFNIPNDTEPNKLIFSVTILIQPGDNVQENEEHMFRLSINDAGEKVFTITVGPQGDYPVSTVISEIFARILFSRIALKAILAA